MDISGETLAFIFIIIFILAILVGIVYAIFSKNKSRGSSMNSVTFFGATSEFQTLDQKGATEHVLEIQADKKFDEEESGDPEEK